MAGAVAAVQESDKAKAERLHEHLAKGAVVRLHESDDKEVIEILERRAHGLSKHKLPGHPGYVELRTKQ